MDNLTKEDTVGFLKSQSEEKIQADQSAIRECTTEASEATAKLVPFAERPHAQSLVTELYPDRNGCYIALKFPYRSSSGTRSQSDLYRLELSHPNYQAIYSAALAAALNRLPLLIRTTGPISSSAIPKIEYVTINY